MAENGIQLLQFGVPGNKEPFADIPEEIIQVGRFQGVGFVSTGVRGLMQNPVLGWCPRWDRGLMHTPVLG